MASHEDLGSSHAEPRLSFTDSSSASGLARNIPARGTPTSATSLRLTSRTSPFLASSDPVLVR